MPTVNDPLKPAEVLEKLNDVRATIGEIARKEAAAREGRTENLVLGRRKARLAQEESDAEAQRKRNDLILLAQAEMDAAMGRHESRKEWIQARYHDARQALTDRISAQRDRLVGRAQGEMMKRQEELRSEYAEASTKLGALLERQQAEAAEADRMAYEASKAMCGFKPLLGGKFRGKGVGLDEQAGTGARAEAEAALADVKGLPAGRIFRYLPLPVLLLVAIGAAAGMSGAPSDYKAWLPAAGIGAGVVVVLYLVAWVSALGAVNRLAGLLESMRASEAKAVAEMSQHVSGLEAEIKEEAREMRSGLSETLRESDDRSQEKIQEGRRKLERQLEKVLAKEEDLHRVRMKRREATSRQRLEDFEEEVRNSSEKIDGLRSHGDAEAEASFDRELETMAVPWAEKVSDRLRELSELGVLRASRFPEWTMAMSEEWEPPSEPEEVVPFATLRISRDDWADILPEDGRFELPEILDVPLALGFPEHGSVLLEGRMAPAADAMNALALRLLSSRPAGQVAFTIIDPVGLGRDFAGLMHLADYEDAMIHGRIWTQPSQIEARLGELNEHVEKVIQMYLRNEYATISEYNLQAGEIAEKYQFVFIAGFPTNFSDTAVQRLRSLAVSGARCGVFLILQVEKPLVDKELDHELRRSCVCLKQEGDVWRWEGQPGEVLLDHAPEPGLQTALVHRFGKASVDSNRIEVPFSSIAPEGEWWRESTADELRVPIGRTGARKLQYLSIGKGTRQHVLIAGKTGSGKSTLFHVMITNLALYCSPEEVEFYLVDFKKGVEFKVYGEHQLPHARVVAIESDREFGLSVLRRVDDELRQRGELFRECGAQDVAGYRGLTGKPLPRTLLLIDEFQELFTEDDGTAQEASLLLDRIVRQGRAFGIHVILGSQTLGGAYTLARATLGQMVIRIALQCNEADAYLIMDDDNPAPRMLTRPGEGIYNDNAGALSANSPFQTVWLPDAERAEKLEKVREMAKERHLGFPKPIVFEGNAPADLRDNELLSGALAKPPSKAPETAAVWLGAPNSIKGPTEAVFRRQSGSNLLAVGQGEERMKALMESALVSLSAQYPANGARFVILDAEGEDGDVGRLARELPQAVECHLPKDLGEAMQGLVERLQTGEGEDVFVFIRDLHRWKALREEDEFKFSFDDDAASATSPAKAFQDLVREGSSVGIHLLVTVDTWNNVGRWIPRKAMADFQMRVLFQMSANDSSALTDSPLAGGLGLHRALLYDDAMGSLETFRPYSRR